MGQADLEFGHSAFVERRTMLFLDMERLPIGGFGETVTLPQDITHSVQLGGSRVDTTQSGVPLGRNGDERGHTVGKQGGRHPIGRGLAPPRRKMSVMLGVDLPVPIALEIERCSRLRGMRDHFLQLKLADERDVERSVALRSTCHGVVSNKDFNDAIAWLRSVACPTSCRRKSTRPERTRSASSSTGLLPAT